MKNDEKTLTKYFRRLASEEQKMLVSFAEFLCSKTQDKTPEKVQQPIEIAPGENESVVGALKRLSKMYPMLDKSKMLNDTSVLVSQHVIQGRAKEEVVAELEEIFRDHYRRLKGEG